MAAEHSCDPEFGGHSSRAVPSTDVDAAVPGSHAGVASSSEYTAGEHRGQYQQPATATGGARLGRGSLTAGEFGPREGRRATSSCAPRPGTGKFARRLATLGLGHGTTGLLIFIGRPRCCGLV